MDYLKLLRRRHLAVLWASQVLSALGDYLYSIAVVWMAVQVAGSGAALVAAAFAIPRLLLGPIGGVFADRWNRRVTMAATDAIRALAVAALPFFAHFGLLQLWELALVAAIIGALDTLFDPALQASLPALAGDARTLQATNGLMDATRRLARVLGPTFAGLLVAVLPLRHFFTLDAVTFALSALAILSLGTRYAWQPERAVHAHTGLRGIAAEIGEALRLVRGHGPLAWGMVAVGASNLLWSAAFTVGVPLLASRTLHAGIGAYGLIVGAYGVGNILSNLIIGSLRIRRRTATLFAGKLLLGVGFVVVAVAPSVPVAMLGSAFAALGGPMGDIMLLLMIQTDLPSAQVGKVYSLRMTLESAGASIGLLLAVPLFAALTAPLAIGICALAMLATGALGLWHFGLGEPERAPAPTATRPQPIQELPV